MDDTMEIEIRLQSYETKNALEKIVETKRSRLVNILVFNSVQETGAAALAIKQLTSIHVILLSVQAVLAILLFQALNHQFLEENAKSRIAATTFDAIGFFLALVGVTLSLMATAFLKSIVGESLVFQVEGILEIGNLFQLSELTTASSILMTLVSFNIAIYDLNVPTGVCVVLNFMSCIALGCLFCLYKFCFVDEKGRNIKLCRPKK